MKLFKCKIFKISSSLILGAFLIFHFFIFKNQSASPASASAADATNEEISVVVNNFSELAAAITGNNNYNTIYLNADIEMTARIDYPVSKTNLTINGTYTNEQGVTARHTLTDMNSSSITDSIYIASAASEINVTLCNLDIIGKNYYGLVAVAAASSTKVVTLTYENVNYTGPQISYNRQGMVRYIDSNITIKTSSGYASPSNELAEANRVEIGGKTVIHHTSTGNAVFWFTYSNPSFKILENANVTINSESRETFYCDYSPEVTIGKGANFTVNTPKGMFYDTGSSQLAKSFLIENNASLKVTQTAVKSGVGTIRCSGDFTVSDGASLYIANTLASSAPLLQMTATGAVKFENPKSVVLYNKNGNLIRWTSGTGKVIVNSQVVNYWLSAKDFPEAGTLADVPLYIWDKLDKSNVEIEAATSTSATTAVSTNVTSEDSAAPPSLQTFNLQNVRVLSMGQLALKTNAVSDAALSITGMTNSLANLKAEFLISSESKSVTGVSDASGAFSLVLPETLALGTSVQVTANDNFKNRSETLVVVYAGALEFKTVPSTLAFKSIAVPAAKTTIQRQEANWSIVVSDSRALSSNWGLYVSAEKPFTSASNHALKDAFVFIDEKDNSFIINSEPTKIYSGSAVSSPADVTVVWPENQGMLLVVSPQDVFAGSYSTTVTWTLTDAP